jgi:hypothetical protein
MRVNCSHIQPQWIVVLEEDDIVIVLLAYPFFLEHNDQSWRNEKANLNLVADFIAALPAD